MCTEKSVGHVQLFGRASFVHFFLSLSLFFSLSLPPHTYILCAYVIYECDLKNRLITQPQYFIASPLPFLSVSLPSLASLFFPIHPSGRNLVSKYEELVWSSPPLGLMSFWLCPSTRLFYTSAELVLCVQMGTWRVGVHPRCFVLRTCVFALHTETWFPAPRHRKCPATY